MTERYAVFVSNNKDFITEVEQVQQVMTLNDVRDRVQVISYHLFKSPINFLYEILYLCFEFLINSPYLFNLGLTKIE